MVEEEEGKPTKIAHSMVAKDGEVTAYQASLFLICSCQRLCLSWSLVT